MKLIVMIQHQFELWETPAWFDQRLRQDFPGLQIVRFSTRDGCEQELDDAEIIFTWALKPEQFARAARLQWIHCPAAAVHQLMFRELVNSNALLTNGRNVHGKVVAEHVLALIFALAKNLPYAMRLQARRVWGLELMWAESARPREVSGATVGLVGVGSIGREAAKSAAALGMNVIATRQDPGEPAPEGVRKVFGTNELSKMLGESDYVVLAVPVTASTKKMIDAKQLAAMRPNACLINIGRGAVLDEAALVDALRTKTIAAAALDVFEKEPLPQDSPLWKMENVLITPHTAGLTDKLWERQYAFFSENLRRFMNGQPLLAVVDKQKGY
ncbi:MAG TPA: D-2-hydroxyacid dehydrogenase [Terriglobales bacterium]|nr:D-2-hydroxyacid dehydrogenase [Terriglobales bacterium]